MINKVYLDMDGVLCNFELRYFERYGEMPGSMRDKKNFNKYWDDFVLTKQFETLDLYPDARDLLDFLKDYNVSIEILSSSGGEKYHEEVKKQKRVWLDTHNIPFKANIVSGRKNKALYANDNVVLIDDTYDVIRAFIDAGGHAIHHKTIRNTLALLKNHLDKEHI